MKVARALAAILVSALALSCTAGPPLSTGIAPTSAPAATTTTAAGAASSAPTAAAIALSTPTAAPTSSSVSRSDVVVASSCKAPATPTTASTEGPFFKAGSPERSSLATQGMAGTRITLVGLVETRSCTPVVAAKVDIWQADASGNYDNTGYTLRGYVRTDANGRYRIETIVPAQYPGRTPHIHVKVEASAKVLTTQLYMPNVSTNASDGIFRPDLVMQITPGPPMTGAFSFIVDLP